MRNSAMDFLDALAKLTPEEFDGLHKGHFYVDVSGHDRTIFGHPVTEEMWEDANILPHHHLQSEINAIFGSGGSGTWNWPVGGTTTTGGTNNSNSNATPSTQTLYRRNTHDENGNARQFSVAQDELWKTNVEIASMTNAIVWKSAEEIANDANAYRSMMARKKTVYYSKDSAELVLEILANNGMLECKNG